MRKLTTLNWFPNIHLFSCWLYDYLSYLLIDVHIFVLFIIKSQISSLVYSAFNCQPKTILFKVWKRQLPSVLLWIILKLEVRGVAFISSSSDSKEYLENSSVISSAKISLPKQFSYWLSVWVDLWLTLINLWLFFI